VAVKVTVPLEVKVVAPTPVIEAMPAGIDTELTVTDPLKPAAKLTLTTKDAGKALNIDWVATGMLTSNGSLKLNVIGNVRLKPPPLTFRFTVYGPDPTDCAALSWNVNVPVPVRVALGLVESSPLDPRPELLARRKAAALLLELPTV
jgi:hypothetical protein